MKKEIKEAYSKEINELFQEELDEELRIKYLRSNSWLMEGYDEINTVKISVPKKKQSVFQKKLDKINSLRRDGDMKGLEQIMIDDMAEHKRLMAEQRKKIIK